MIKEEAVNKDILPRLFYLGLLNLALSVCCLYFWRQELGTGFIVSIESLLRKDLWRPYAAILTCALLGFSQTATLIVLKKARYLSAIRYGLSFFILSLVCFFYYKNLLCSTCLSGWIKLSIPCHLLGALLLAPILGYLLKWLLLRLPIPCAPKLELYLWWSILASMLLGMASFFILNYGRSMDPLDLRTIQFGHPIFWLFFTLLFPHLMPAGQLASYTWQRPARRQYGAALVLYFGLYFACLFELGRHWEYHLTTSLLFLILLLLAYRGSKLLRNIALVTMLGSSLSALFQMVESSSWQQFSLAWVYFLLSLFFLRLLWAIKPELVKHTVSVE